MRVGAFAAAALLLPRLGARAAPAQTPDSTPRAPGGLPTPAEAAAYLRYTRPDSVASFLGRLSSGPARLSVERIGRTAPFELDGRVEAQDILVAGFDRADTTAGPTRPRVLILASQHGDEPSGTEAALRLLRDLALGDLSSLREAMDVRVVPLVNPAGSAWNVRRNEQGIDPNRDHLRLRSPEVEAIHRLFARWRPHVVLDLHELGPSVYDAQIGLPTHPDADPVLLELGRFYLLPYVANELARRNLTFHEYVTAEPVPPELEETAEATGGADTLGYYTLAPITANNARNAFALEPAVTYLVEVTSSRGIEDLARRTEIQYTVARAFLEVIAAWADEVVRRVGAARAADLAPPREGPAPLTTLRAERVPDPDRPNLTWRVRSELGPVTVRTTDRWRPLVRPTLQITRPAAWLLDPEEIELATLLLRQGFELQKLTAPAVLLAGEYPVRPDSLRGDAGALLRWRRREFRAGSWLVLSSQPGAARLAVLIEPYSADGWYAAGYPSGAGDVYPVRRVQGLLAGVRVPPPEAPE
ncbi:MAG: M14 family zinc carboxypeptidase [Gemmatimonadota bacterium]